jgi:hypothetical protein
VRVYEPAGRCRNLMLVALLTSSLGVAADAPVSTNLQEQTDITLHQIVTTVSPKNGDLTLCRELTRDSFEVWTPDERVLPIYSIDREGAIANAPGAEHAATTVRGPVFIAFYFDVQSLGSYPRKAGIYGQPSADDKAVRDILASDAFRSSFKPEYGDRLLLALFDGDGVRFETGWVGVEEFTKAFAELESRPFIVREHLDDRKRWSSLLDFGNALANQSETGAATKHVILLSADFDMDAETGERTMSDLASVLERAHVVIHPVDLFWHDHTLPRGIITLSWLAQGELFAHGATSLDAVEKVIGVYDNGCRLIISVKSPPTEKLTLHLVDKRFTIPPPAPTRELPVRTDDERFDSLVKLRYWGSGCPRLESTFWLVKPTNKREWDGLIVAELTTQKDARLPEDVKELQVFASLNDGKSPLYIRLGEKEVDELRRLGSKRLIFEARVKTGTRSSLTVVTSPDLAVGSTSRTVFRVPKPPKPGESASWNLVGNAARVQGSTILLPASKTEMPSGTPPMFMGYGCGDVYASGKIVKDATGDTVTMVPLALRSTTTGNCGWILGTPSAPLPSGKYVFQPPQSRGAHEVRFSVARNESIGAE